VIYLSAGPISFESLLKVWSASCSKLQWLCASTRLSTINDQRQNSVEEFLCGELDSKPEAGTQQLARAHPL
jgi:hypothetical protein